MSSTIQAEHPAKHRLNHEDESGQYAASSGTAAKLMFTLWGLLGTFLGLNINPFTAILLYLLDEADLGHSRHKEEASWETGINYSLD